MKKEKVHCQDCKYIIENFLNGYNCNYPDNIEILHDFYKSRKEYKKLPNKLNNKNNCKWFEKKENK